MASSCIWVSHPIFLLTFSGCCQLGETKRWKTESQRVVFLIFVIWNKHTGITDCQVTKQKLKQNTFTPNILANYLGRSNCESCIFTVGRKKDLQFGLMFVFLPLAAAVLFRFFILTLISNLPSPKAVKWRDYKDVCAAVWKILLIPLLILASFQFTLLLKLRKMESWSLLSAIRSNIPSHTLCSVCKSSRLWIVTGIC